MSDVETFLEWPVSGNWYEVGSGKTVVSTVVSLMRGADLTIVAVPPILITPWGRWLRQVSERVVEFRGTPKKRAKLDLTTARWIIVSHAMFRQEFDKLMLEHGRRSLSDLIVDEAHAVKSHESKLFLAVQEMTEHGCLQMLTGTPISKPLDAYAYIALKTPKLYRSYFQMAAHFVAKKNFFGAIEEYKDLSRLAGEFAIQTITRTRLEIHGYNNPPNYPDCAYELSDAHSKLYEQLVEEQLLQFDDGQKIDASTANKLYHALQQIVVNFDYFSNDPKKMSNAFELLDLTIEQTQCVETDKSKLIVWTNYRMTSARVLRYLLDKGIKAVAAYGGANSEKSVEAFMGDPETRVLVGQYQSCGAGLNPQAVCWESLFLELTTVPIYMRQALGRIDRYGQQHVPTQRLAFALGTVQEALLARLLKNDDEAVEVEATKESMRKFLLSR